VLGTAFFLQYNKNARTVPTERAKKMRHFFCYPRVVPTEQECK